MHDLPDIKVLKKEDGLPVRCYMSESNDKEVEDCYSATRLRASTGFGRQNRDIVQQSAILSHV